MFLKALRLLREWPRRTALVLVSVLLAGAALADNPRAAAPERIIAIGDLHGDYDAYVALLSQAGLIDAKGRWAGKKAIFVQTGDAVDRGPRSRDIILHLQRLQKEASRAGGKVIALIGNHEAMNMTGDLRYVPPAEYQNYVTRDSQALREHVYQTSKDKIAAEYRQTDPQLSDAEVKARFQELVPPGYIEHRRAWAPNGEFGRWVLSNPSAVIVGDSLFVHGGLSLKYAPDSLGQLDGLVHGALSTVSTDDDAVLQDDAGPLWYRGLAAETEDSARDVDAVLKAYDVKRIIIGHTPNLAGIKVLHQGRVIMIDTGISASYHGTRSYLTIEGAAIFAHDGGKISELKDTEFPP